ncbi:MAG: sensor histidine kinase [Verrucomicrobia bacterium]|nr:sensor histidine kinase [Verrucomicrobiota bacterium]
MLVFVVGAADYATGTSRSMLVFYLIPLGITAWFLGLREAVVIMGLAIFMIIASDHFQAEPGKELPTQLWNTGIALSVFSVVTTLVVRLRRALDGLEARVRERTRALTNEMAVRQRLECELLAISEREQRSIGHELHDSICQHLTGTALAGQVLTARLQGPLAEDAARVVGLVEEGIDLTRRLARGLVPVELESAGLMSALEEFARATQARTGVQCRFECEVPVPTPNTAEAIHLFRIAQEATNNAIRHGNASQVLIKLDDAEGGIQLSIEDDGCGVPEHASEGPGMGLRIMAHRASMIGGSLNVSARAVGGTSVTCTWPTG